MREMESDYMIKSKERTTEYYVIVQPRHREHSPICYKGYAKDEEEAASAVFNSDCHKQVLDAKASNEIEWNTDTAKRYWKMYGEPTEVIDTNVNLF